MYLRRTFVFHHITEEWLGQHGREGRCATQMMRLGFEAEAVCPHPPPTPAMGHGVRESRSAICSVHGNISPAALWQPHAAVSQHLTHFHCCFAPPHYHLETPRDFPSRLLWHTTGNVSHKERQVLGSIPTCPAASIDASAYTSRRSAAQGKPVHYGGLIPDCCSHCASPQKALTALWP